MFSQNTTSYNNMKLRAGTPRQTVISGLAEQLTYSFAEMLLCERTGLTNTFKPNDSEIRRSKAVIQNDLDL